MGALTSAMISGRSGSCSARDFACCGGRRSWSVLGGRDGEHAAEPRHLREDRSQRIGHPARTSGLEVQSLAESPAASTPRIAARLGRASKKDVCIVRGSFR
jgi:hypothetical protein